MATENVYIPQVGARSALDHWTAAGDGPALAHLYVNNLVYLPTRVLADYVEASFVGYAPFGPIPWSAAFTNGGGKAQSDSLNCLWTFTGGSGTADVFGIYLTDAAVTKLLAVVPFLVPVTLKPANPSLARVLSLTDRSEL